MIGEGFDQVLCAAKAGDTDAIERLYRDTVPSVLGYLRAGGAFEAEDLTSEVYVSMMTSLERFDGDESQFRSWLFTIAHRRFVDAVRRSNRKAEVPTSTGVVGDDVLDLRDTESEALSRLRVRGVLDVIDSLTEQQRDVLLLRVVADLQVKEISQVLGKPETAVKALLRRALRSLERHLAASGQESDERE